ncbi:AAA family ATPase [Nonomuraea thailandensis]
MEAAIAGGHRLVLIDGEPGVGKTRLLEHLVERAEAAGRTVLAGSATEFERLVPFGVYVDAFTRLSDTAPEGGPAEAALGTLLSAGKADQLDRYHTYRSIRSFLARLADDCGAVVALDDLHWADAPSLELTEFLLRRPPAAGFTLALACRTGTVPPVIAEAVARRDPHVTRLSLAPLDEDAAALLVPPQVDPGRRRLMYRASGGNPLFLRALLDADDRLLSELAEGRPGATLALEQTLLAVLRRELDRLTPPAGGRPTRRRLPGSWPRPSSSPTSPSWTRRAPPPPWTSCADTASARWRARGSPSGIRWCGPPRTTRAGRPGAWPPTPGSPATCAAPTARSRCWPTTPSGAPSPVTSGPPGRWATRASPTWTRLRRPPYGCSARRCGCCRSATTSSRTGAGCSPGWRAVPA